MHQPVGVPGRNWSQVEVLVLDGFQGFQNHRYLYFSITLAGYVAILMLNLFILVLISGTPSLHRPVYVLLANLQVNTLLGCSIFYPKLLHDLLQEVQLVSRSGCVVQAFGVHVYVSVECNLLTIMAYDRYAAVAHPLAYHRLLDGATVWKLLLAAWALPVAACGTLLSLTGGLPLCAARVPRVFCDNRSVSLLSCEDIALVSALELVFAAATIFLPLCVIFFCYVQILAVSCRLSRGRLADKALVTCVPHLVSYVSLVVSIVFEVVQPALAAREVPPQVRVVMSMEGFLVSPLLNPLIYGLKMPDIRNRASLLLKPRQ
ncbi:olfactory receptor 10J1-like [Neosynchiropus ocellatus]